MEQDGSSASQMLLPMGANSGRGAPTTVVSNGSNSTTMLPPSGKSTTSTFYNNNNMQRNNANANNTAAAEQLEKTNNSSQLSSGQIGGQGAIFTGLTSAASSANAVQLTNDGSNIVGVAQANQNLSHQETTTISNS